jgi:hypothetical protein
MFYRDGGTLALGEETRVLVAQESPRQAAAVLLSAWLAGPETPSLRRLLPARTEVLDCFPAPEGELVIDLSLAEGLRLRGGAAEECLVLAALARTILENIGSVAKIRILINGEERRTLAGHVDLARSWNRAELGDLLPRSRALRGPAGTARLGREEHL